MAKPSVTLLLPPPPPPDTRLMSDPLLLEVAVGGGLGGFEFPPPLFLRRRIILRLELKLMLLMDLDQFLLRAKPCLADIFGFFSVENCLYETFRQVYKQRRNVCKLVS